MAKKKRTSGRSQQSFQANPFSHLKGFAVSGPQEDSQGEVSSREEDEEGEDVFRSFEDEMDLLGVAPLERDEESDCQEREDDDCQDSDHEGDLSDEELFLSTMSGMKVEFKDDFDLDDADNRVLPGRMRQLKLGRVQPQAKLDLHGSTRAEVIPKLKRFFQNSLHHGHNVLLVITGRGLHSPDGEAVLREEAEHYLRSGVDNLVAEWGRAPKEYGGSGALVIFMKKR